VSGEVIEFNKRDPERKCSFCKKPESACKKLIAGHLQDRFICDECVKKCTELLNKK